MVTPRTFLDAFALCLSVTLGTAVVLLTIYTVMK